MSTDELMGHAEDNDGIEEYDNPLPAWWLGLFYLTIAWGVVYAINYHFVAEDSQIQRYEREMLAAAEQWPQSDEAAPVVVNAETVAEGKVIYTTTCASCHGAEGGGGIGVSLVDAEWIHGAKPEQIQHTISSGVIEKGMPAWGPVLGPEKVSKVAAYVYDRFEKTGLEPVEVEGSAELEPVEVPAADADPLVAGEKIWTQYCVACHGPDGEGTVTAPSLVDDEWLHGSDMEQIVQVITNGIEGKAMVAWEPVLGEAGVRQVATFVHDRAHNGDD